MIINYIVNRQQTHPLLVVTYEELKQDTVKEVQKMLDFLNVTIPKAKLVQRLQANQFNEFHRNHSGSARFVPYTPTQVKYLNSVISETEQALFTSGVTNFPLKKYMRLDVIYH